MLSNFDNLDNKLTYLAHTWVFTQGSSTTYVVKNIYIIPEFIYLFAFMQLKYTHDSATTQFLNLI